MAISDDWTIDYGNRRIYQSVGDDAQVDAAYQDDGGAFTDFTTEANSAGANDADLLPVAPLANDAFYFGADAVFSQVKLNIGQAGAGTWTITWEYYNRLTSAWAALGNVTDGTTGFTTGGTNTVTFDRPADWGQVAVDGDTNFWVRARVSAYTSITTQPLGTQIWIVKKAVAINDLYSWLMDTFDDSAQMEDKVPMDALSPASFKLVNQWYLAQDYPRNSFHYLTGYNEGVLDGGTIETDDWTHPGNIEGIRRLTFAAGGYTNAISTDIGKVVTGGTTGDTSALIDYDNTNKVWIVRCVAADDVYDNGSEAITIASGTGAGTLSAVGATGEWQWTNVYTLGSIVAGTSPYVEQDGAILSAWWESGHMDALILTKRADVEIDSGNLIVYAREYGDLYDHFALDVSAGARQAVPLATQDDPNNDTARATVDDYAITIAAVSGKLAYTGAGGYVRWETITGNSSGATAIVIEDDTGSDFLIIAKTNATAFTNGETINGGSGSGDVSGTLDESVISSDLDISDGEGDSPYNVWINANSTTTLQLYEFIKYVCDEDNGAANYQYLSDGASAISQIAGALYRAYDQAHASPAYTEKKQAPFATYAGGSIFGARGVAILDLSTSAYQLIDADGVSHTPPVTVTGEVTGLADSDRVGVFELDGVGGDILDKYTLAANNDSGDPDLVVKESIAAYHPSSGFVRVKNPSADDYDVYPYSSYTGSTFTLDSDTLDYNYTEDDPTFVPFLDALKSGAGALSKQYQDPGSSKPVIIRVRQKGIKPFEVESDADGGFSIPAVRTTDNVVT